ncbi:hypothetical protein HanPI659440_Chr08g0305171 [Helianthus annuus]|nr:hypothetical protein HanPI659440_Chr08g0305171 [Helianthus annuus]
MGVLKDLKIADLEKELRATKDKAARMLINFDYEKHDITQDAKVSAAITMYKIQLQMAAEAQDPSFDKSTWDVEGWRAGRRGWQSWRMMRRLRRSQCLKEVMLARIRGKQVELVVMVQRRFELQNWAMKETSRHSRSPIF